MHRARHLLFVSIVAFASTRAFAEAVTLAGDAWSVTINPATLETHATTKGGESLAISTATVKGDATDVERDGQTLRWNLMSGKVGVVAALEHDVFTIDFTAADVGTFTWPIVTAEGDINSLIVPLFEGVCIPTDDADWAAFLKVEGPYNTTGDLSMPFFAAQSASSSVTYTVTNEFNNEVRFDARAKRLGLALTHTFTRNHDVKTYGVRVQLSDASPVAPAKLYRQSLIDSKQFVTMKEKIAKTPDAARLLGAAHIYVWGDGMLSPRDVTDFEAFAAALKAGSSAEAATSTAEQVWTKLSGEAQALIKKGPQDSHFNQYEKRVVIDALNAGVSPEVLLAAFPNSFVPRVTWGDGTSTKMIDALAAAKLDRLWIGSPSWAGLSDHPAFVASAKAHGYLVGPYDSYHSIHAPGAANSWETAQFDRSLYDTGGVIPEADGSPKKGFLQRGYILSPRAARPALEARVNDLAAKFQCNSWFMDCDATGENFDDYSPSHPATQAEDQAERISRLAWIRDQHHMVIGSEGGAAYAASTLHFAHGEMTPVIGWGDEQMKDKKSPYYLGAYYPPEAPAIFFKTVPLKPAFAKIYTDPRTRVPLYETVFHDSVIATHQWGYGTLKFEDPQGTRTLLELLYNVPPLYHLNLDEFAKRKGEIVRRYAFFSPLHREASLLPMTEFRWLTEDRLVQRTTFGGRFELTANFGDAEFVDGVIKVAAHSIVSHDLQAKTIAVWDAMAR